MDPVRKRRFSRDLGISLSTAIASLQVPNAAIGRNTISLRSSGTARIIFHSQDPTSFEGVLITDDGSETFAIKGNRSRDFLSAEDNTRRLVDVNITDGETGQLYVLRNIDLLPPDDSTLSVDEEKERELFGDPEVYRTLSGSKSYHNNNNRKLSGSASNNSANNDGVMHGVQSYSQIHDSQQQQQTTPRYELRSEALTFSTDDILVGNRADKEIRSYLNPSLASRLLNVHIGRMKVDFNTAVTPPPTPIYDRARRKASRQLSNCSTNGAGGGDSSSDVSTNGAAAASATTLATDADVNFLM